MLEKQIWRIQSISTHTPLVKCDLFSGLFVSFQLTHPLRGVTLSSRFAAVVVQFQLTHLLRGVAKHLVDMECIKISTHTPFAGYDYSDYYDLFVILISTHTPLAKCDESWKKGFTK